MAPMVMILRYPRMAHRIPGIWDPILSLIRKLTFLLPAHSNQRNLEWQDKFVMTNVSGYCGAVNDCKIGA